VKCGDWDLLHGKDAKAEGAVLAISKLGLAGVGSLVPTSGVPQHRALISSIPHFTASQRNPCSRSKRHLQTRSSAML
jgi:hypothetical protein